MVLSRVFATIVEGHRVQDNLEVNSIDQLKTCTSTNIFRVFCSVNINLSEFYTFPRHQSFSRTASFACRPLEGINQFLVFVLGLDFGVPIKKKK